MLWLVYALAWLPALGAAYALRPAAGGPGVLTAAGTPGLEAGAALAVSLGILTAAYAGAIRRPPATAVIVAAAAFSLAAGLAMPLLFSADAYAYAYYGDLVLHGRDPYSHGPAPQPDALGAAAVAAWGGHVPPRCVYGPVAVAIAALADGAGAAAGVPGQILAQRLAAAAAFGVCLTFFTRLERDPRTHVAFALNPVVLWSVAEGHNDAAMLALVLAGCAASERTRPVLFALAAAVKAPALLAWAALGRTRAALAAALVVVLAYVPLGMALVRDAGSAGPPGGTATWDSPLGLLAAAVGRAAAVGAAVALVVAAALGVRRLPVADRVPAFALAAWFALPNAYPWYALWIVPLAARNLSSIWSRALLAAALAAPVRALADAAFAGPETSRAAAASHTAVTAVQILAPLAVLGLAARGRRTARALLAVCALAVAGVPASAQTAAPSPQPVAPPVAPVATPPPTPVATPPPTPVAAPQSAPTAAPQTPPATVQPLTTIPPQTPQTAQPPPRPAPPTSAPPSPAAQPAQTPSATPALPTPAPTPNPFAYIITPTPVPATSPDGPHILEVDVNDRRIRAGGPLLVRVVTSANVVGVEARALGRFIPIPQNSPGLFALAYTMPDGIPFWLLNRTYDIVIAAATADGRQTSVSFPMLLTR